MKMEINVKITNDKGEEIIEPVTVDTEVPEFDEFVDASNFREVFHRYEQSVLKIRNMSTRVASECYLTELSKKKPIPKPMKLKIQE